ncbi:MAG: acyl-CoA thioesterase [Acidimicrobiales bacterium]
MIHTTALQVRWYELDPYRHVNHAVYLQYCEVARIEALESVGFAMAEADDAGLSLVVAELTVKFRAPARFGDRLEVDTWIRELGRVSSRWRQRIRRADALLAEVDLRAGAIDRLGRPCRLGAAAQASLQRLVADPTA